MENGVFRFQLFRLHGDEHVQLMFDIHGRIMCEQVMELSAEVGHGGSGGSVHETYVQDDRPLAPPPIHVAIPEHEAEEGEEESDEDYVANSESSDGGDEDEFVPETPAGAVARHVLPPPHLIPALLAVPSHYHSLDLDAMHERTPVSNTYEVDYNLEGNVEFWVGHRFRSREAVLYGVKNYSIRKSVEYRVIKSDQLKYHVQCRQADSGCQWSLRVALRQNLGYWEVRRFGGPHSCLAPTISQDHRQLDSSLICRVILSLIQSNPSISISVLQGAVQASYHFKHSYRKVWMAKQKAIARIYGDWEESYNKVPKLLQALQSCFPGTIRDLRVKPYYDGHFMAFKHCKPFLSVDSAHLYGKYGRVLFIVVAQDRNSNILPIAFAIVESESTESWSFFLTNLRHHVTPQDGLLVISDRSQAIKATLSSDDSGWHPPRAIKTLQCRTLASC
ncbi:uncharacterized protein LOC107646514 [Arachis ipaensis]|uniref:uncharacterized protein LOC107646514 n=1 Tax=Arachis ipaensis TaxID=130454 RepID=UPI0007AF7A07|nr:uncharacterized protein LOC107646514 [Arachis ipaensis]XP_025661157.1 uncharacterized protein LOC112756752 [Arachis hypogaea]